jgi:hypothetical protein
MGRPKSECGMRKLEEGRLRTEDSEVGSRTRRRPKRKGLCRGTDAEGGKKKVRN